MTLQEAVNDYRAALAARVEEFEDASCPVPSASGARTAEAVLRESLAALDALLAQVE